MEEFITSIMSTEQPLGTDREEVIHVTIRLLSGHCRDPVMHVNAMSSLFSSVHKQGDFLNLRGIMIE